MKKYDYKLHNLNETFMLANKIGKNLFPSAVITLEGDLGAGKTTFTKGIAKALGITKTVNSPTFTIIKEYEGNLNLYHIDAYRLDNSLEDLGFDEYFFSNGVTIVEWGSKIYEQLPKERLHINFYIIDDNIRTLEIFPFGEKYKKLCEVVFNE